MKITNLRTRFFLALLCVVMTTSTFAQTAGTKPNIIVILADDLGYADVGFNREANYPTDRGVIPTPNIDLLANNGIICKNAHVAHPFCGPSRVAIMTGMYPHRIGAQYNLPNDITTPLGIPTEETYFSKVIQDAGYNTGAIGKWHLGFSEGKYQPLDRGFDFFFGFLGGGKQYFESGYEDAFYRRQGGANPVTNEYQDPLQRDRNYVAKEEFEQDEYLTDVLTDETIGYIQAKKNDNDPFFIYLAYNAPHTPLEAPADEIAKFKTDNPNFESDIRASSYITNSTPVTKLPEGERPAKIDELVEARIVYATMVANMDANIGRIVAELKKDINVFNNTVIIFLSDNGGYTYSKGAVNHPLQALKGSVNDGGHKVPFFVHWPNKITTPSTYDYKISSLDLYPTLVNLAGGTIPQTKKIDGKDFMDKMIAGEDVREGGEAIFVLRPQNGFHNGTVISYPWKIVRKGSGGSWALFNTETDPGESNDVSKTAPNAAQIIKDLKDQAIAWVKEFKNVKPAWFDHERNGGHPHRELWFTTEALPQYNKIFDSESLALSVEELFDTGLATIYPNPTNEDFKILFSQTIKNVRVDILSLTGLEVKSQTFKNSNAINIETSGIESGNYIVRIVADNLIGTEKVIKL